MRTFELKQGCPHPLGATLDSKGVNFAVFSRHATAVQLLLFRSYDEVEPCQIIDLDPKLNRTSYFWHVYVKWLPAGYLYAFRVFGPHEPSEGHRFDPQKVLLDPYAKAVDDHLWDRAKACHEGDNLAHSMRSMIVDMKDYDWDGDEPLGRPMNETIIYEMHVAGFTKHPSSNVRHPGTYWGVIEKIPYLKDLGVTAVELLPVFEFDENEILSTGPNGKRLKNYWGYSPVGFFSPHRNYCVFPQTGGHIREFRDMVKALHRAGIEVILDVVFNHTSEGNELGPCMNFRGLDNRTYYHLSVGNMQYYMNYSGCGNTLNCNHPVVSKFISDCLEFWVKEMHVDGFRFDEASILCRDEDGSLMRYPPALWNLDLSETLANTKLIAEVWDATGLYQVGMFPGFRWAEWNGRYRDDVRRFVKGDAGLVGSIASRVAGSADLYENTGRLPTNSVNFITCHDGFTLNDLVSYNEKHNWANGEENRDGHNDNLSWNCGFEGDTADKKIDSLRRRQIKNFTAILMLSRGVPMITAGDEVRRTQFGNNNAYCQDNEINWLDWTLLRKNADIYSFFKYMIEFRKTHRVLSDPYYFGNSINARGLPEVSWHGCKLHQPGWEDGDARVLSYTLGGRDDEADLHIIFNMYWETLDFELPKLNGRQWYRAVDTALSYQQDVMEAGQEVLVRKSKYSTHGRSVAVLLSK